MGHYLNDLQQLPHPHHGSEEMLAIRGRAFLNAQLYAPFTASLINSPLRRTVSQSQEAAS